MNTGTPIFKLYQESALNDGVSFNILTQSDQCDADEKYVSSLICFSTEAVLFTTNWIHILQKLIFHRL